MIGLHLLMMLTILVYQIELEAQMWRHDIGESTYSSSCYVFKWTHLRTCLYSAGHIRMHAHVLHVWVRGHIIVH
jgi:hypothetical protein